MNVRTFKLKAASYFNLSIAFPSHFAVPYAVLGIHFHPVPPERALELDEANRQGNKGRFNEV
jgi:hypothetical protein